MNTCHNMHNGEILNNESDFSFYKVILYGDKTECAKFSKRVGCAIKHLPVKVQFFFEYNTKKAVEKGIKKSPTLLLNGNIFIEGLIQAEEITKLFENLVVDK